MTCKLHLLGEFAERYQLSFDWLFFGDLEGLQRMTHPKTEARASDGNPASQALRHADGKPEKELGHSGGQHDAGER
jgi:hypothetical protein